MRLREMSYERKSVHFWILARWTEIPCLGEQWQRLNVLLSVHGICCEKSIHFRLYVYAEAGTQNRNVITCLNESTRQFNTWRTKN